MFDENMVNISFIYHMENSHYLKLLQVLYDTNTDSGIDCLKHNISYNFFFRIV